MCRTATPARSFWTSSTVLRQWQDCFNSEFTIRQLQLFPPYAHFTRLPVCCSSLHWHADIILCRSWTSPIFTGNKKVLVTSADDLYIIIMTKHTLVNYCNICTECKPCVCLVLGEQLCITYSIYSIRGLTWLNKGDYWQEVNDGNNVSCYTQVKS